jgi:hypothetical protein
VEDDDEAEGLHVGQVAEGFDLAVAQEGLGGA